MLLTVADVCGKGLQASLVMTGLHGQMHAYLAAGLGLAEMVERLNEYLCQFLLDDSFVTAVLVVIDPQTGKTEAINAGHLPPIVVDGSGTRRCLRSTHAMPLGIASLEMTPERDQVSVGETLVMFTDGLTEMTSESGRMLGLDGLTDCLSTILRLSEAESPHEVAARLKDHLERFRGNVLVGDDCASLVARRTTHAQATAEIARDEDCGAA